MHPKSSLCPLQEYFLPIFSYFGKSLWDKDMGGDVMTEECIMSPHTVCPSPWRQHTRTILNWAWLKNGLWTLDVMPGLLIHIYFGAAGVTGQKEKHS